MPKRVYGLCPDCGRSIGKRGGKLKAHTGPGSLRKTFDFTPKSIEICPGSGKKVETIKR